MATIPKDTKQETNTKATPRKNKTPEVTEQEMIHHTPARNLTTTITLYPDRPLSYGAIWSSLVSAYLKDQDLYPDDLITNVQTPSKCLYYSHAPVRLDRGRKLASHPTMQLAIVGELLGGQNQLYWGDVQAILRGLL
ncbi:MAG: hypothetical protein Q9168_004241, partial [Polycauliona sp. 1 TL-2023]